MQTTPGNPFEAVPDRDDLVSALRTIKQEWRDSLGIEEMGVFGSFARCSATEASDLDIHVRTRSPNPYLLVHLKQAIEGRVHRKVDIARLRERRNPSLRRRIGQEGVGRMTSAPVRSRGSAPTRWICPQRRSGG